MEWEATDRALVLKVAWPLLRVPVPRMVVPSLKVTVPVGVPVVAGVTVAVKVTDCPETDGFAEEAPCVEMPPLLTVCARGADMRVLKLLYPLYCVVMEWEATDRAPVLKVAWPLLRVPVPRVMVPSLKVTVPLGMLTTGATVLTVAVKVTDCPETDGFAEEETLVELSVLLTVGAGLTV